MAKHWTNNLAICSHFLQQGPRQVTSKSIREHHLLVRSVPKEWPNIERIILHSGHTSCSIDLVKSILIIIILEHHLSVPTSDQHISDLTYNCLGKFVLFLKVWSSVTNFFSRIFLPNFGALSSLIIADEGHGEGIARWTLYPLKLSIFVFWSFLSSSATRLDVFKVLSDQIWFKSCPNILWLFGLFWKILILKKNFSGNCLCNY